MKNSLRFLVSIFIGVLLVGTSLARAANYPVGDLRVNEESTAPGAEVVATGSAFANTTSAKWNSITVRLPAPLDYRENFVLRGQVSVTAGPAPHHLGVKIIAGGKTGYVQIRTPRKGPITFQFTLSDVEITADSKIKEALAAGDQIQSITIYTSYEAPVESTISLDSFSITLR